MINTLNELYEDSKIYGPQLQNQWELYIDDWNERGHISKLKVVSTDLPFLSLEKEKRHTGQNYYVGYSLPDSMSITFREDSNFSVRKYFEEWQNSIFDSQQGVFKSGVKQTKTAVVTFFSYRANPEVLRSLQNETWAKGEGVVEPIRDTSMVGIRGTEAISRLRAPIGAGFDSNILKTNDVRYGSGSRKVSDPEIFEEVETRIFTIQGLRFLGIDTLSLNYSSGGQLELGVSFAFDFIKET